MATIATNVPPVATSDSALSASVLPPEWTLADLLAHLGGIPLERIRVVPPLGSATEKDVTELDVHSNRLYELIDGVLVEKPMGLYESLVATVLIRLLGTFVEEHDLGLVAGEAGTLKILPNQVRIPDVSFLSWGKFPNRQLPREPIPAVAPDLAVEVLSAGNTAAEMQRKLHDYFAAGVRLVWYIEPRTQTATMYTAEDRWAEVSPAQSLSGGEVVPGFELPLRELFAKVGPRPPE